VNTSEAERLSSQKSIGVRGPERGNSAKSPERDEKRTGGRPEGGSERHDPGGDPGRESPGGSAVHKPGHESWTLRTWSILDLLEEATRQQAKALGLTQAAKAKVQKTLTEAFQEAFRR
jgi:hypothetical protein